MSMDAKLAAHFGTDPSAQDDDQAKVAQAELFAKIAAEHGVDVNQLSDAQVEWFWDRVFNKTAGDGSEEEKGEKEEKKEKKEASDLFEAAQAEFAEKRAQNQVFDEATMFGKTAAHAYVAELREIASEGGLDFLKEAGVKERLSGAGKSIKNYFGRGKNYFGRGKELMTGSKARELAGKAEDAKTVAQTAHRLAPGSAVHSRMTGKATEAFGAAKEEAGKVRKARIIAGAAGIGGVGGGAAAYAAKKKKEGSFDLAAANLALSKVAELEGVTEDDIKVAEERLTAVLTLGLEESEKLASINDFNTGLELRALEMLESAGYEVTWNI